MGVAVHKHDRGSRVQCREGVFGTVEGYIGTVEAQGRGTLHLHMLVWLQGALTAADVKAHLQSYDFRCTVASYIASNIRGHHDHVTEDALALAPREKAVSYSRPLGPRQSSVHCLVLNSKANSSVQSKFTTFWNL
jgi:hypothetical protein